MTESFECDVFNGETHIGTLARIPGSERLTIFAYDPDYQGPALSHILPKNGTPITSEGLHPFFCNLISEGWLKEAQEKLIQQGSAPSRFDMLAYFGNDCIGSLRVVSKTVLPPTIVRDIKDLSGKTAGRMHAMVPGVQGKLLAVQRANGDFVVPTSRTQVSTHIAKLPHHNQDFTRILENEYVTTLLSGALLPGDPHSATELSSVVVPGQAADGKDSRIAPALLIKRFDRTQDSQRVEMYEFNQLLGKSTEDKYEGTYKEMADFIRSHARNGHKDGIKTNMEDIEILFRRILVSFLLENSDTHLKNFALIRAGDEFRLSPNYDLVSCARYPKYRELALGIGFTRNIQLASLQPKHIVQLAADFGIIPDHYTFDAPGQPEQIQRLKEVKWLKKVRRLIAIVKGVEARVKELRPVINGKQHDGKFGELEKIANDPHLKGDLKIIFDTVEKRRNGILAGVEIYLAKRFADRLVRLPEIPPQANPAFNTEPHVA